MGQYLPLLALVVLGALFAGVSFAASRFLNPPHPTKAKVSPYECGIVDQAAAPQRFPVKFFLVAMIFIVFDIEIIFLYPFAMIYRQLGSFGLVDILVFSGSVFIPFAYLISKGALDWGPAKRHRSSEIHSRMVSAQRTSTSTVRRVGTDGRGPFQPRPEALPEPVPGEAA